MNKMLVLAGLFMVVSLMYLASVFLTGNGFGLILGVFWLAGSGYVFIQYRKMKVKNEEKTQEAEQEAIEG